MNAEIWLLGSPSAPKPRRTTTRSPLTTDLFTLNWSVLFFFFALVAVSAARRTLAHFRRCSSVSTDSTSLPRDDLTSHAAFLPGTAIRLHAPRQHLHQRHGPPERDPTRSTRHHAAQVEIEAPHESIWVKCVDEKGLLSRLFAKFKARCVRTATRYRRILSLCSNGLECGISGTERIGRAGRVADERWMEPSE